MINTAIHKFIRFIFVLYIFIFPKKIKFKNLNNLDFSKADFTNYKKIKILIFKNNFIKNNNELLINNFDFLKYSAKIGGKKGIEISKNNIFKWHEINNKKINNLWASEIVANRIINLIYNYDHINSLSTPKEETKLKNIISTNIKRFNFELSLRKNKDLNLLEFKASILINILLGKYSISYKKIFEEIIENQIDKISIHKSYNIIEHSKFVNHINEIINIFLRFKIEVPDIFFITKLKMATVLSQYFHKDGSVCLFNGAHNGYIKDIYSVLKEENNLRKMEYPTDENGIFFFEDKFKKIFFDVVQPSKSFLSKNLNASTLSIEFSSGKDKIFTNCGALEKLGGNAAYLRYTAAHSTLALKNTNISEIKEDHPHLKFPQIVNFKKTKSNGWISCEGSHNGYIKNYKKIIKRKIFFKESDESLYGEDWIISTISANNEVGCHVRFHIMPDINITETNNKRSVIIKTNNKNIWIFKASANLVLEESIYVDKGDIIKTNQIVIKGITKNNREMVKWSLIKI